MYVAMLIGFMLIFPMASIVLEGVIHNQGVLDVAIAGRWFVFWAVGVRLLIAGLRQIVQPRYTAETILGVKNPGAIVIVRELGFANTAIGSAGLGCIAFAGWTLPLAVIGAVFYALAGMRGLSSPLRSAAPRSRQVSKSRLLCASRRVPIPVE